MDAKLVNFSEISKLGSVKNRLSEDIFSLFGLFRLSQTIKRLGVEKHCGIHREKGRMGDYGLTKAEQRRNSARNALTACPRLNGSGRQTGTSWTWQLT